MNSTYISERYMQFDEKMVVYRKRVNATKAEDIKYVFSYLKRENIKK